MVIVASIAALCNTPYFFVRNLSHNKINQKAYFDTELKSLGKSSWFWLVYDNILYPAVTVWLPVIILLIVIVTMKVVLRKRQRESRHTESSHTPESNINTVVISVLVTFLISQFPRLIYSVMYFMYDHASYRSPECGSVLFYTHGIDYVFVALNSAANPFIYIVLRNHFTWLLRHPLRNERAESVEMSSN